MIDLVENKAFFFFAGKFENGKYRAFITKCKKSMINIKFYLGKHFKYHNRFNSKHSIAERKSLKKTNKKLV